MASDIGGDTAAHRGPPAPIFVARRPLGGRSHTRRTPISPLHSRGPAARYFDAHSADEV